MSIRSHMRQVARTGAAFLPPERREAAATFIRHAHTPSGGFSDRAGAPDLYYTLFGVESACALGIDLPTGTVQRYLQSFNPPTLDLVHLACLTGSLDACEAPRCGIAMPPGGKGAYGLFLAALVAEDLGAALPDPREIRATAECPGLTTTTAAATVLHLAVHLPVPEACISQLSSAFVPQGGARVSPFAPVPDLLSTATAAYALASAGLPVPHADAATAFVMRLQHPSGGFAGFLPADQPDCEYTWYALLALGVLKTG